MTPLVSRRALLSAVPTLLAVSPIIRRDQGAASAETPGGSFPAQDPALVKEMVTVAHGNVARVRELVSARPTLARAVWDWGYGDWETALGAASHVGNREIAELLIANGAHPTIFSAAMLGQLDVVKAFAAAQPAAKRIRGPHGITLLAHAQAGGPQAVEVVRYLEAAGDADPRYPNEPLSEADRALLVGTYAFGGGATERLVVAVSARGALTIKREGAGERTLFHQGARVFNPPGAEAVRIRFEPAAERAEALVVEDGPMRIRARRITS